METYVARSRNGRHPDDQAVTLLHSRVVQKSYGTEKRCVVMHGDA